METPLFWLTRKLKRIGHLDNDDLTRLANLPCRMEHVPRFRSLVREGKSPEQCCLLANGYASRYKDSAAGVRQIVSFHLRGDLLDIQQLLLAKADHSVETITPAAIAWIPKSELLKLAWRRRTSASPSGGIV